jgi:hypothetical protein
MAELAMVKNILEDPENQSKPGLSFFYDRESRLHLAGPEFSEPPPASESKENGRDRLQ